MPHERPSTIHLDSVRRAPIGFNRHVLGSKLAPVRRFGAIPHSERIDALVACAVDLGRCLRALGFLPSFPEENSGEQNSGEHGDGDTDAEADRGGCGEAARG